MLSTEFAELRAHMADNPGAVIEDVARQRKVTPRAVIEALPPEMVRVGAGSEFAHRTLTDAQSSASAGGEPVAPQFRHHKRSH